MIMNEDFVSYEIAKKLKEKGFREKCKKHCYPNSQDWFTSSMPECDNFSNYLDIPTISQVLKWLREEKKFYVVPLICSDWSEDADGIICEEWLFWSYRVINVNDGRIVYDELDKIDNGNFEDYERAALAGIKYVLDNLI